MAERTIKCIYTPEVVTSKDPAAIPKRRVAAYARVSTASDEQLNSIAAQKDYFERMIRRHPDWILVDINADAGLSGTSTRRREGFSRMIADALEGKIDLIITKSLSRFARNMVDTLNTIRQLKEHIVFSEETEDEVAARVTVNWSAMRHWALQYCRHVRIMTPTDLAEQVQEDLMGALAEYRTK